MLAIVPLLIKEHSTVRFMHYCIGPAVHSLPMVMCAITYMTSYVANYSDTVLYIHMTS